MKTPPKLAKALLHRFCNIDFIEEIEGDLDEQFQERIARVKHTRAALAYWRDVFHALITHRNNRNDNPNSSVSTADILKHLFTVSIRHLQRNKLTTIINSVGLAISLACFILIGLYIVDELTYDTMHPHASQVYRISQSFHSMGTGAEQTDARAPGLWTLELKNVMPEIKHYTRMSRFGYPGTIRNEKRDLLNIEPQFFWVDSTYTDIFALPLVGGGDPRTILHRQGQVIINETMASKYFGTEDPIGQSLIYARDGMDIPLIVGGVMKNYPSNVHFHPDFISNNVALMPLWNRNGEINSSYSDGKDRVNSWSDSFTYSYVELSPGIDAKKVDPVLRQILKSNLGEDAKYRWPAIVKLTDIHFRDGLLISLESPGDPHYLYIFGSIGVLILLIACINYMNLATAKSMQRSREVGLRKTLGVRRRSLIGQFMGESIMLTSIAMFLALALVTLLLPNFHALTGCTTTLTELITSRTFFIVIGLTFIVGVVSGSYPAFFLSGFRPLDVLKRKVSVGGNAERFRKSLVVIQFTITFVLVVGTLVIQHQLSFINDAKLSKYKDQVLAVRIHGLVSPRQLKSLEEQVKHQSAVDGIASGTQIPRQDRFPSDKVTIKVEDGTYFWDVLNMDFDFATLFHLEFISGRNFSSDNPADSNAVIINQAALQDLHVTAEKAIGLAIEGEMTHEKKMVIGVVKDFNIASLRTRIQPTAILGSARDPEVMYIKLAGSNFADAISSIERTWKQNFPSVPFNRWFLNEEFEQIYHQERSMSILFQYFAVLGIIIGCLGLFGLASFTVEQRTKEIGIRKVLGATGIQILLLITYRFVKLILVSLLIGIPLSVYLMNNWLSQFAYQASIGWFVFVGSALFLLTLTCLTVGVESMKAALKNPVEAIRHE
jgi:putative ABC transport system permease protein